MLLGGGLLGYSSYNANAEVIYEKDAVNNLSINLTPKAPVFIDSIEDATELAAAPVAAVKGVISPTATGSLFCFNDFQNLSSYRVFVEGTSLGASAVNPALSARIAGDYPALSLDTTAVADGNYKLVYEAVNKCNDKVTVKADIKIDNTAPTITKATFGKANETVYKKAGSGVMFYFNADETLAEWPTLKVGGKSVNVGSGTNYGYQYVAYFSVPSSASEGPLSIELDYKDVAGNSGSTVTSTTDGSAVTVDLTVPTITKATFGKANESALKKNGDGVMFYFNASETLAEWPILKLGGKTVEVKSGTNYGYQYVAYLSVGASTPNGLLSIELNYKDLAGNIGGTVTATTDGSAVTVDTISPEITKATFSKADETFYKKDGQGVMFYFNASEVLAGWPTLKLGGKTVEVKSGANYGYQYVAYLSVGANTPEGPLSIELNYTDLVGNSGSTVVATTDGGVVVVDLTAPTGDITYSTTTQTNGDVTASIETSEPIATPNSWTKIDDTHFEKTFSVNSPIIIGLVDLAGNIGHANGDINWIVKIGGSGVVDTPTGGGSGEQAAAAISPVLASTVVSRYLALNDDSATTTDAATTPTSTDPTRYSAQNSGEVLGAQDNRSWSLANLILTVGAVLASVVALVGYFGEHDKRERKNGVWRVLTLIPAIAGVVVFCLTEDWSLPMTFIDTWSLLMLAITAVAIALAVKAGQKADR
jgi:hypothetical protein